MTLAKVMSASAHDDDRESWRFDRCGGLRIEVWGAYCRSFVTDGSGIRRTPKDRCRPQSMTAFDARFRLNCDIRDRWPNVCEIRDRSFNGACHE